MTPYVLALDIGTSSLKAVVYAKNGKQIASETSGYEIISTQPGWAEANVEEWRKALDIVLIKLNEKASLLEKIKAIAFTGQTVSYTHLRAHETRHDLVCRLLLEKKKK